MAPGDFTQTIASPVDLHVVLNRVPVARALVAVHGGALEIQVEGLGHMREDRPVGRATRRQELQAAKMRGPCASRRARPLIPVDHGPLPGVNEAQDRGDRPGHGVDRPARAATRCAGRSDHPRASRTAASVGQRENRGRTGARGSGTSCAGTRRAPTGLRSAVATQCPSSSRSWWSGPWPGSSALTHRVARLGV